MKKIIIIFFLFVLIGTSRSQNITNTLGSSGVFRIKDGSTTFLNIRQSDGMTDLFGNLRFVNTNSNLKGIIYKDIESFIHNYEGIGSLGGNTFLGLSAGNFTMTSARYNTGIGYRVLNDLTTGSQNTGMGFICLSKLSSGSENSAFGSGTLFYNSTGSFNSGFGSNSLYNNTNGSNNSAFGTNSLYSNTIGSDNSSFGKFSMEYNIDGIQNSAFGVVSLHSNTTGSYNNSIGVNSLYLNTSGSNNNAVGKSSLHFNTSGNGNVAMGTFSLFNNTTADNNTSIGNVSLYSNSTGYSNTGIGSNSLQSNTIGAGNTSIGSFSMTGNTTGQLNTVIGYQAGSNIINGSNVTLLGYNTEPSSSSVSNQITLGNNSVTSLRCNVTTITSLSDARDKKNIHDLDLGLDFVVKLKPRIYNWDKREWYDNNVSDGSKIQEAPTAGFIAQELDEVQTTENAEWLNLVLKDNPEKWEATPGNLLPIMVKAIQELKEKCDSLQNENNILAGKLNEIGELKEKLALITSQIENLNSITDELKMSSGNNKNTENNIQVISNENTK